MSDLRCGDLVEVEWESDWYPGVVSDIPTSQELAVNYVNGDFEESVPANAGRLRSFPPRKRPGDDVRKGSRDRKVVAAATLRLGANRGDIGLVMEALGEGADPCTFDDFGYVALHWVAGPDEGMPGDTISRRACVALLSRMMGAQLNVADKTHLGLRGVQHAVVRNLVGCVKTFHYVGADMRSTVHWAVSQKCHGVLRELLALGVTHVTSKAEWDGCSPLMLSASSNDAYGIRLYIDHVRRVQGELAVCPLLTEVQQGKLRSSPLHYAADAAADSVVELLLELRSNPNARSARGETPVVVARRRAQACEKGGVGTDLIEAAIRCGEIRRAPLPPSEA